MSVLEVLFAKRLKSVDEIAQHLTTQIEGSDGEITIRVTDSRNPYKLKLERTVIEGVGSRWTLGVKHDVLVELNKTAIMVAYTRDFGYVSDKDAKAILKAAGNMPSEEAQQLALLYHAHAALAYTAFRQRLNSSLAIQPYTAYLPPAIIDFAIVQKATQDIELLQSRYTPILPPRDKVKGTVLTKK